MPKALIAIAATWLLSGCVQAPPPAPSQAAAAGPTCLALDRIAGRSPAGGALRFELADGSVYTNVPQGGCPPLARASSQDLISFEVQGNQICSGDRFRIVDPSQARGVGIAGAPQCRLGRFVRR